MVRSLLQRIYENADSLNRKNILDLVRDLRPQVLLDLGCDEGSWTCDVAEAAGAHRMSGVEIVESRAQLAAQKKISVTIADLGAKLPLLDGQYDLIHANQVIEHVPDIDLFAREIKRLLRPGGSAVISTENASSWHNVFAAAMGWQMFSLTNISEMRGGIGNPVALHRHSTDVQKSWTHKVLFSYRGLIEFFEAHGFENIEIRGAGYHPLPASVGAIDVRHSHFITVRIHKPA
jgi:SAM-dependent methyltransferase